MRCRVELIYDLDCPNVGEARTVLLQAFAQAGASSSWAEWDRKGPDSPAYVQGYGSPTILVNGQDVAGAEPGAGADCCRLYSDGENGFRGVPAVDQIVAALTKADSIVASAGGEQFGWRGPLAVVPGIGVSLFPVATCPACWAAYAGVFGTLGLGFLLEEPHLLLPVVVVSLGIALASLVYRAKSRRGYGPVRVGGVAVSSVLGGKFVLSSDPLLYLGLVVLMAASLWNSWPKQGAAGGSCARCAQQGSTAQV